MKAVFISYRRKDTVDVAGRIFDRLSGYFGPGSVLLDVDALVSGANYRTQIAHLLERCSVVLAVIGQEWLTAKDDAGQRRLDNPDDQLRIEIAVALKSGKMVIPILVHDACLPAADELPEELKPLAACAPLAVQSGTPFNTDMQLLVERLEGIGLRPPESHFPWQMLLMPLGIAIVLAGIAGVLVQPLDRDNDFALQQLEPTAPLSELRQVGEYEDWDRGQFDRARFDGNLLRQALLVLLPLTMGPMLIVWGKRRCCLSKERTASRRHYAQGAGRLPMPKSGKSVLCLALGLGSIGAGPITAIPALAVGALAWVDLRRHPTWMRGRSLVVVGVLASCAALVASGLIHVPRWRMRSWLAAMERATAAEKQDHLAATMHEINHALESAGANAYAPAVTRVRRAEYLIELERYDEAAEDLTAAIEDIDALAAEKRLPGLLDYEATIGARAHTMRAEAFEQLGRAGEARADRAWDSTMLGGGALSPVAPLEGDVAPEPPAPPLEDEAEEAPSAPSA
jgi:tetratricopeptide (TPR) repeat protein